MEYEIRKELRGIKIVRPPSDGFLAIILSNNRSIPIELSNISEENLSYLEEGANIIVKEKVNNSVPEFLALYEPNGKLIYPYQRYDWHDFYI